MPFGKKSEDFPKVGDKTAPETFVDSLGLSFFDGQTYRLELCTIRMDEIDPPKPPSGTRHVVARLIFTPEAAVELMNSCMQMAGALQKAGLITKMPEPGKVVN